MKELEPITESNELGLELLATLKPSLKAKSDIEAYKRAQQAASMGRLEEYVESILSTGGGLFDSSDPNLAALLTDVAAQKRALGSPDEQAEKLRKLGTRLDVENLLKEHELPGFFLKRIRIANMAGRSAIKGQDGTALSSANGRLHYSFLTEMLDDPSILILEPPVSVRKRLSTPAADHFVVIKPFDQGTLEPVVYVQVD